MKQHLVPYSRVDVIAVERKATAALAFVVDHFLLLPIGVLIVVSLAASAGFTFALFFATAIMPAGPLLGEAQARCAVHCPRRLGGVGGSAAPPRRSLHSHAGGQTHTKARAAPHMRATGLPNRKPALADCPHTRYLAHLKRQVESAAHRVLDSM